MREAWKDMELHVMLENPSVPSCQQPKNEAALLPCTESGGEVLCGSPV